MTAVVHAGSELKSFKQMKNPFPVPHWTRRGLLRAAPALWASTLFPRILPALSLAPQAGAGTQAPTAPQPAPGPPAAAGSQQVIPPPKPFSKFTDVAHSAGLNAIMYYGTPEAVTYIVEEMGGGCAFFDYDNDGWMDIFILSPTHCSFRSTL